MWATASRGKDVGARAALEDRNRQRVGHQRRLETQGHEAAPECRIFGEMAGEVRVAGGVFGRSQLRQRAIHLRDLGYDANGRLDSTHAF